MGGGGVAEGGSGDVHVPFLYRDPRLKGIHHYITPVYGMITRSINCGLLLPCYLPDFNIILFTALPGALDHSERTVGS